VILNIHMKVSQDLSDENIVTFCFKKKNEEIKELKINSATTFSEDKTAFELLSNFARSKYDDDKLLNQ